MEQPKGQSKEQSPLLKVENGVETVMRQPVPTARRELKRALYENWPKVLSGYWTLIAIFMTMGLIVYSMNMNWYKKSTSLFAGDYHSFEPLKRDKMFFYHVLLIGIPPAFSIYSEFLTAMTDQYPSLDLNICFLIVDSRLNDDLWPRPYTHFPRYNSKSKRDWLSFEKKYDNVKISFMRLSSFMGKTPMRHHWRNIPYPYLSFYARVYSVWKQGGVGMDLKAYNNRYNRYLHLDRRVSAILSNHNDQSETNYNAILGPIDEEEENCFINLSNRILNETASIINKLIPIAIAQDMKTFLSPLLNAVPFADVNNETAVKNTSTESSSITVEKRDINVRTLLPPITNEDNKTTVVASLALDHSESETQKGVVVNEAEAMNKSEAESPHIVFLYGLSVATEDQQKPAMMSQWSEDVASKKNDEARLVLSSDGTFAAATQKYHRFLDILLKVNLLHKLRPDFVIRNTFLTECSDLFKYEDHCHFYHL